MATDTDKVMSPKRFVLLDRDGTLNVERHYLRDPEQLELLPGVLEGLRHLHSQGLGLIVVTNQSGVGRGYFDLSAVEAVHARLVEMLNEHGIVLDGIYLCPHGPDDGCTCRKPRPGMVEQAVADLGFDPKQAFVIGDKASDICLGQAVGATTLLVQTGYGERALAEGEAEADHLVADLREAANAIAQHVRG